MRECIVDELDKERGESLCIGESIESESCSENTCPIWTDWTDWTQCSASCGGGVQKRIRDCILPKNNQGSNDFGCDGDTWEMRPCNEDDCPVWTDWTPWSPCTKSCGGGKKVKTRKCVLPESLGLEKRRLFCPGKLFRLSRNTIVVSIFFFVKKNLEVHFNKKNSFRIF